MENDHPVAIVVRASRRKQVGACPFCRREMTLTFHHLMPRKVHRRRYFQRNYARDVLARGIYICRDCHDAIHRSYDEMELARTLATPQALAADEKLRRQFHWLSRQRRAPSS
ncbi:MAG: hypothetical protein NXI15_13100 [Gammaproteobacteria bacterium]|nr:hypothetical protein [Gammaproteobacteria bacterium]